ncbi:ester cyclase [Agrobacterium tumefaciens]|nr:ester cyclase [Agrobacterium tumefaciens]
MAQFLKVLAPAALLLATAVIPSFAQTAPRDLAREEANRKLVVEFYDRFFNRHETEEASKVVADNYKQHNPEVPDGKEPFVSFFTGFFKENPNSRARIVPRMAIWSGFTFIPRILRKTVVRPLPISSGWSTARSWNTGTSSRVSPGQSANENTMF